MSATLSPVLDRIERALRRPVLHYFVLLAFALAFYGYSLSFGLIYEDRALLAASHWGWFHAPWVMGVYVGPGEYVGFYRPLLALVFAPALVSSVPVLLHLENIVVGTLIVFLFGRVLLAIGFSLRLTALAEAVGVVLPTSMALFVWISQRTDWLICLLGLALVLLIVKGSARIVTLLLGVPLLGAGALFSKESGIGLLLLAPALLAARRARGRSLLAALAGLVPLAAYGALKARFVPDSGAFLRHPAMLALRMVGGFFQVFVYSWLPICFTSNWLYLALGTLYGASALMGFVSLWRERRFAAGALLATFAAFGVGTSLLPVPRNLMLPGLVVAAFACHGAGKLLEPEAGRGPKTVQVLLLVASLCALANLSVFSSYALQSWVEPINARLEGPDRRPDVLKPHPIDMNPAFPSVPPAR